jgi:di/tricarboxylate transporter
MLLEQWLVIMVFCVTLLGLLKFQHSPERVFGAATLVCLAFGLVEAKELLHNAVNPGLVTLILLVLGSIAFERTSMLRKVAAMMLNGTEFSSKLRLLFSTAVASAIMNNTAVVATLMGTVKSSKLINPGKLLLPLSFAAILGGTITLVGTSTNLIVNSMLIEQGHPGLHFFDFTLIGCSVTAICLLLIFLRMPSLPEMNVDPTNSIDYLLEAKVASSSTLIGKSIEDNGLRNLDALFLVEIVRAGRLISPVEPDELVLAEDKLIFSGDISKVLVFQQFDGLSLFAQKDGLLRDNLTEVLIKADASIIGKSLKSCGFRARFDAAVVAIRREGEALSGKLGELELQAGDFLVLAVGNDFASRSNLSKNFYILSGHEPDNMLHGWRDKLTVFGFLAVIGVSALTSLSLLKALIFYVALLVATNCLNLNEIKRRFPLEIWLVVLSALTLANALENTGVAALFAQNIEHSLQAQSIYIAFVTVFLLTLLVTELITNNAAAALLFPIAYNIAIGLNADPLPFVMAVAFAASGSFISPYGYQTNVMVYNAANYQLKDFIAFGLPVSIVYSAVVLLLIPQVFPF